MENGILLIDKHEGVTSTSIDRQVGKIFSTSKVGHLGTLDPFATGLLIVAVNKGSKYLQFIPDEKKSYFAQLKLGVSTSTGDSTGSEKERKDVEKLSDEKIANVLSSFLGKQTQIPPMTSSIKVGGKALYKLAHKGIEIERKPRNIEIFNISFIKYENNILDFTVTVSKGTYIRVLGEDIAKKLNTVGHLVSLRRLSIENWLVHYAKNVNEISKEDLLSPDLFVTGMKHVNVNNDADIINGKPICLDISLGKEVLLMKDNVALAVYKYSEEDKTYHCVRGLF